MGVTTTISRGRFMRCTVAVDDAKFEAMRRAPEIRQQAIEAGAKYWHDKILPGHFEHPAHNKYGYAWRSKNYTRHRTSPDLVNSGSMRNDLSANFELKTTGTYIELRMRAKVLNFVPRMSQDSQDLYVKHGRRKKDGHQKSYPNLLRELKLRTEAEMNAIASVVSATASLLLNAEYDEAAEWHTS
jgi:hypothetical protein